MSNVKIDSPLSDSEPENNPAEIAGEEKNLNSLPEIDKALLLAVGLAFVSLVCLGLSFIPFVIS